MGVPIFVAIVSFYQAFCLAEMIEIVMHRFTAYLKIYKYMYFSKNILIFYYRKFMKIFKCSELYIATDI